MLMIHSTPKVPCSCTPLTSLDAMLRSSQLFVDILQLTKIIDLVFFGFARCCLGYMTVQCGLACVHPRNSMCGSCITTILYSFAFKNWSKSSCPSSDWLMFCCHYLADLRVWLRKCYNFAQIMLPFHNHSLACIWQIGRKWAKYLVV